MIIQGDNLVVNGNTVSGANMAKIEDVISVDANNRALLTNRLTVKTPGADGILLDTDNNNVNVSSRLILQNSVNAGALYYSSTSGWVFNTDSVPVNTSGQPRVNIDLGGRVLMPYQPAFWAAVDGSTSSTFSNYQWVYTNVGSCFNATTGLFTAPVAGTYLFAASVMDAGGYVYWYFKKNGSIVGDLHHSASTTSGYSQSSGTAMITLAVNDTVGIGNPPFSTYSSGPNPWTSFSGHLIG